MSKMVGTVYNILFPFSFEHLTRVKPYSWFIIEIVLTLEMTGTHTTNYNIPSSPLFGHQYKKNAFLNIQSNKAYISVTRQI